MDRGWELVLGRRNQQLHCPGGEISKFLPTWGLNQEGVTILEVKSESFCSPGGEIRQVLPFWK